MATFKRDAPPAHYTVKIESFSQLLEFLRISGSEKYESHEFEVGGYKWKLSLYPNGNKKRNGSGHISLYLVLSETNDLPLGGEVTASYKLFVYDQIRDKYLTVEDVSKKQTRFYAMKVECGFSQFLPLEAFNDASGYLMGDCCIFGAEVFVTNCTGKGERVSIKKPGKTITYEMKNFPGLENKLYCRGPVNIEEYNWFLNVYPCGDALSKGKYLSMFLRLDTDLCPELKVWASFKFRVKNQVSGIHAEATVQKWFHGSNNSWGYSNLLLLSDIKEKSKGYTVNDTVIVEVEFTQLLASKVFS